MPYYLLRLLQLKPLLKGRPRQGALDVPGASEDLFTEGEGYTEDDDEEDDDEFKQAVGSYDEFDTNNMSMHNFNWLDTSLADGGGTASPSPVFQPASHHLAHYGNSRSAASSSRGRISPAASVSGTRSPRSRRSGHRDRDHYPRQPRWHFGIRSSSPPMEVMTELYRTLEALGIQWRQKRGVWSADPGESEAALRAAEAEAANPGSPGGENGATGDSYEGEPKENLDVYYIECRWRVRNTVVRALSCLQCNVGTDVAVNSYC